MKITKIIFLIVAIVSFTSCASRYKLIEPKTINYVSARSNDGVKLEYKYDLLRKKYKKKEEKKGIKLVAIKVTNNTEKDLMFGRDITLHFLNNTQIFILENDEVYKTLKQSPASYLWYLLLTPVNFYTYETNGYGVQETTNSVPIGLVLGPGLAGGNMIASSSANKKFKTELLDYNIYGTTIKKGETKYGLIGIKTDAFDALKLKLE